MQRLRQNIYQILEITDDKKGWSWYIDLFLMLLIMLNIIALVLESISEVETNYGVYLLDFELFSVAIFSLEYLLRIWASPESPGFRGRLHYMTRAMSLIDLLAILPFFLSFLAIDLRFIRVLRLLRLLRLFKIVRYISALQQIGDTLHDKREQLMVSMAFILLMLLVVSSTMYHIEHTAQPDVFSSIPETMWWGVATLTTVGYGDMYPITPLGKFLGGIISILGVGLFALPTSILAAGFAEALQKKERSTKSEPPQCCPHCGKDISTQP
ncbi:MAG: ion transporter [Bernardetiaceae bacterium]